MRRAITIHFRSGRTPDVAQIAEILRSSIRRLARQAAGTGRRKGAKGYVMTEAAIAFKLRLRKPLIERGVVRKAGMLLFIVDDITWLVASKRAFDVYHCSRILVMIGIDRRIFWITNSSVDAVRAAELRVSDMRQGAQVQRDFHAEIDPAFADGHADTAELQIAALFSSVAQDIAAAPA